MSSAQAVPGVFSSAPAPRISGTVEIGKTVTASTGTWAPAPDSFTYQWKRNGSTISGATSKTYTITQADAGAKLTVTVTGVKANYSSTSKTSAEKLVPSTVIVRVTSDIVTDTTWAPTVPTVYIVSKDVSVASGSTLTIAAGTVVKFAENMTFTVEGSLVVNGTSAAPVTFTSLADDSVGGDTLADGDDTKPENNRWNGIYVSGNATLVADQTRVSFSYGITSSEGSDAAASAQVTGSTVDGRIALHSSAGAVTVTDTIVRGSIDASSRGGATTVSNNTVSRDTSKEDWDGSGFVTVTRADGFDAAYPLNVTGNTITNGSLTVISSNNSAQAAPMKVTGNTISEAVGTPLTVADVKLRPSNILANTLRNNTINAIALSGTLVENWTLPTTGPQLILNRDLYDRGVEGGIRISAGSTLTVAAGTVVKVEESVGISVEGSLIVNGTAAAPVTFTSLADDSVGGDTLADGDDTKPENNRWNGIYVSGNATLVADQTRVSFSYGITSSEGSDAATSAQVTGSTVDGRIALHSSAGAVTVTDTIVRGSIDASSRGGATTVSNNTVSRDTSKEDWDGSGFVTVTRADGFDAAYPLNVTGNTITNGSLTVVSSNNSAQAAPMKVTGNTISEAVGTPLTVADVRLRPSNVLANTLRNNTINAIALSGTLVENWTLPTTGPQLILNRDLYDRGVEGGIRISAGSTLTVAAGTVVKVEESVGISVEGSLIVNGTAAAPVTFTSLADDSVGGDTLADGDDTKPENNRWNGIYVSENAVLTASNLIVRFAWTAISTSGETTLRSTKLERSEASVSVDGGTTTAELSTAIAPVMTVSRGSAELRGTYTGPAMDEPLVSACGWGEENCSVDAAYFGWGTPGNPATRGLACGAVTVAPWAGVPADDKTLIWSTPNCDGSMYEPQNDLSDARASASEQVASWQALCGIEGYESACEVAGTYSRCLSAAQQFARDHIAVSFPLVPLDGESLGVLTMEEVGESMKASRTVKVSRLGGVLEYAGKVYEMAAMFWRLTLAYNECAPGYAPER
ncbi:hypothetical protein [Microbacterium testaceum]|uniref:hypothetical protein n=1 Tax=Microbacterium testaceum TaxID=2033 RepID=UPI00187C2328|nr:hypothetical protein [Microbacterium testaceum]